jgi:hypothetical protein
VTVIENLKATAPPEVKKGQKRLRPETLHLALIKALEDRIDAIDAELLVSSCFAGDVPLSARVLCFCSADPVLICCPTARSKNTAKNRAKEAITRTSRDQRDKDENQSTNSETRLRV